MNAVTFKKQSHEYFDESGRNVPCVSDILKHFGISKMEDVRKFVGDSVMDASSNFGDVVHATCALHDQDDLAECDPQIFPYLKAWKSFLKDYNPQFLAVEKPMISGIWGFAGTPDRITSDGKYSYVVDIKTGVKTVSEEIQTALYQILAEESLNLKIAKRYSIHLTENYYSIVPHSDRSDINTAKSLITAYNYKLRKGLL